MNDPGWIKLHRILLDKPIWIQSTPEQKTILITLLVMANHVENEWEWKGEKFKVKPGQFITSLDSIVKRCGKGISIQNVRSAIVRFEKLKFLTNESTKTGRLITIVNYSVYQENNDKGNIPNQQRGNKEVTTNKNDNNNKNNIYSPVIEYLNLKAGTSYRASSRKTQSLIDARLNDGYTLKDFERVIDIKAAEWKGTDFEKFLRPETLFSNKFESYLNQKPKVKELDLITDREKYIL